MRQTPDRRWCLEPERIAAVDGRAIEAGLTGAAMMETAGRSVADALRRAAAGQAAAGKATILIGGGNNGGDGLVAARHLAEAGWNLRLLFFTDPEKLAGDAGRQWQLVRPSGLAGQRIESAGDAAQAVAAGRDGWFVDALLGTGLTGEVREPIRSAILALNDGPGARVIAVDSPSGLDGRTGQVRGVAVRAGITVTFGFPKPGLFLADGPEHVGRLIVAPLGYPPAALAEVETPLGWTAIEDAEAALPPRRHDAHKGSAGRLLVVAGSEDYRGAALLAATAALRSGVGMCVVAAPGSIAEFIIARLPSAIVLPLAVTKSGRPASRAANQVAEAAKEADAIAIGPGLTEAPGVRAVVGAALDAGRPAVVDADGLNVLAADPAPAAGRAAATVLTPHPGELGRWLDRPAAEIDADRVAVAREAAGRWECTVVLKGSPTVIARQGGGAAINLTGNPGLAVGGSGDVLTGLIGSLLAQGVPAERAATTGPFLHGLAADWARHDLGERGLVPEDLFRYLPLAIREVSAGRGAGLLDRLDHRYAALLS